MLSVDKEDIVAGVVDVKSLQVVVLDQAKEFVCVQRHQRRAAGRPTCSMSTAGTPQKRRYYAKPGEGSPGRLFQVAQDPVERLLIGIVVLPSAEVADAADRAASPPTARRFSSPCRRCGRETAPLGYDGAPRRTPCRPRPSTQSLTIAAAAKSLASLRLSQTRDPEAARMSRRWHGKHSGRQRRAGDSLTRPPSAGRDRNASASGRSPGVRAPSYRLGNAARRPRGR